MYVPKPLLIQIINEKRLIVNLLEYSVLFI